MTTGCTGTRVCDGGFATWRRAAVSWGQGCAMGTLSKPRLALRVISFSRGHGILLTPNLHLLVMGRVSTPPHALPWPRTCPSSQVPGPTVLQTQAGKPGCPLGHAGNSPRVRCIEDMS